MSQKFSIEKELRAVSKEERSEIETHLSYLQQLARELGYVNFFLRDDSRLAFLWASFKLNEHPETVVHEMAYTQFLHANTSYGMEVETSLRRIAASLKENTNPWPTWTEVWRVVAVYGPDLIKYSIVERIGGVPMLRTAREVYKESAQIDMSAS